MREIINRLLRNGDTVLESVVKSDTYYYSNGQNMEDPKYDRLSDIAYEKFDFWRKSVMSFLEKYQFYEELEIVKEINERTDEPKEVQKILKLLNDIDLKSNDDVSNSKILESNKIFIVHGHDKSMLNEVARFVEKIGLEAIILHEQPNEGRTIIEKFEHYSSVQLAIVLMSPDDVGGKKGEKNLKPRARQNVILELGYFIGKLGRKNVITLFKNEVEIPSDYSGVIFIPFDDYGSYRLLVSKEIKKLGLEIDLNTII